MGISIPTAILGAGALSAGAGLIGSSEAANAQTAAGNAANTRLQPYQQTGLNANTAINNLIGNGPNGSAGIQQTLENMPGYQFQRNQALLGVANQASAMGLGSNALVNAGQTANNIAGTNYQNYFSNLMNLTNLGQNSAVGQGQNTIGIGNAQAASYMGGANAISNGGTLAALGPLLSQNFGNNGNTYLNDGSSTATESYV